MKEEKLILSWNGIRMELVASEEDMKWIRPLFTRHKTPFLVLSQLGYVPVEKEKEK